MIVLDTNVVSELFRPRPEPRVIAWLEALTDDVAITTITLTELLAGVRRLPDGRRRAELEAAICRAHRATCATRNTKDFVQTGAELVDPWSAP